MDRFVIEGGRPLRGELRVSGSKNAALPMLAAALLADGESVLHNVPALRDVDSMIELLGSMGARVTRSGTTVTIDPAPLATAEAPYEFVRKMRASIYVLGPLLARFGRARVSLPGGCAWGPRPVDLHIEGMRTLGAAIELDHGYIDARATSLLGKRIVLDVVSVGATANLMMAACLAEGTTSIVNAAREPHISALGSFLVEMGAQIQGLGTDVVTIEGVARLSPAEHSVRPDYIEAGTMAIASAVTGGDLLLRDFPMEDCRPMMALLGDSGVSLERVDRDEAVETVRIRRRGPLSAVSVTTAPHPGFPTDMQAQLMAMLALGSGTSVITEAIYPDRFSHVPELRRMGARIELHGNVAVVEGVERLAGAPVMATDLRASAAMVLAGLVAEGETILRRVYHIDRGYEAIEKKLRSVGAEIRREK
ncbi:MAG: UDP-N-acetylglucosamine 1-carboxyvinyltransferase [Gemmatimonadetes bacterium]|nr:UDP-N-acetylglucosamine 1-carboxyvinyltransferase [Gemmatimonadota bacterium]